jgi:uncharacterized protein YggE
MKTIFCSILSFCWLAMGSSVAGQGVSVTRDNKTVAVTVTESLEVQPEVGVVTLGYHNFGRTQDAAYEENTRMAAKVLKALLDAGIKKEDIETQSLSLGRSAEPNKQGGQQQDKERQFEAQQTWRIRLPVGEIQKGIDGAVAAGANDIQEIEWSVKDPKALAARARSAAITRARGVAEELAQSLGGRVGTLLFVSNSEQSRYAGTVGNLNAVALSTVEVQAAPKMILNLFPQKVTREATIYAVFALE